MPGALTLILDGARSGKTLAERLAGRGAGPEPGREFEPYRSLAERYAELFDAYRRAGESLQPLYPHLGGGSRTAVEP